MSGFLASVSKDLRPALIVTPGLILTIIVAGSLVPLGHVFEEEAPRLINLSMGQWVNLSLTE